VSVEPTGATPTGGARNADCGPDCAEALERLEAYLDGELPQTRVEDLAEHLRACHPCADRVSFEEQLRNLVRRRCVDHAPAELVDRVRARLRVERPHLQEQAPLG
jgi:mycothiol system anti-sigma-R factor